MVKKRKLISPLIDSKTARSILHFFGAGLMILFVGILNGCKSKAKKENPTEWISLFNGENLDHWTVKIHHYETADNFGDTFRVEDGILKVRYDNYEGDFNDRFGHLYYDTPFEKFHLIIEYRFVGPWYESAPHYTLLNSGVMFHSQDPKTMLKEQNWPISVEMQLLAGVEEGVSRPTGNMCSPGTEVFFQGSKYPEHCIRSTSDTFFGDQWVTAELIVYGDSLISHHINGEKVLEYTKPHIGGGPISGHDPKLKVDGKALKKGFIALQSEGQPIDFRKVMLKRL